MKRAHYILLTAILFFSACDKHSQPSEEVDNTFRSYIFFGADVLDTKGNMVEGGQLPASAGTDFGVFGFRPDGAPVFTAYRATAQSGQHSSAFDNVACVYRPSAAPQTFVYDGIALWHSGNHTFYAYYPYENPKPAAGITGVGADFANPYVTYTQPTTLADMTDVMTAQKTASSSGGEVIMNFEHRLFAIDLVINNSQFESRRGLKITGADITFYNVGYEANLYYADTNADGLKDVETSTYRNVVHSFLSASESVDIAGVAQGSSSPVSLNMNSEVEEGMSFLFLPCQALNVNLVLSYINAWDEEYSSQISADLQPEAGFLPGHRYKFIVNKVDKDIDFKPELQEWDSYDISIEFN